MIFPPYSNSHVSWTARFDRCFSLYLVEELLTSSIKNTNVVFSGQHAAELKIN